LIKESNAQTSLSHRSWASAISGCREHHQGAARRPIGAVRAAADEVESQVDADSSIVSVASV
jgi:hypothetical protein